MSHSQKVLLAFLLVFVLTSDFAIARTWKDKTGKFSVEAEFLSLKSGILKLRKIDGTELNIPIEKLSKDDQRFAQNQASGSSPVTKKPRDAETLATFDKRLQEPLEQDFSSKTYAEFGDIIANRFNCSVLFQPDWISASGHTLTDKLAAGSSERSAHSPRTWFAQLQSVAQAGAWTYSNGLLEFGKLTSEVCIYRELQAVGREPVRGGVVFDPNKIQSEMLAVEPLSWSDKGGSGSICVLRRLYVVSQTSAVHHQIRTKFTNRLQAIPLPDKWSQPPLKRDFAPVWAVLQRPVTMDAQNVSLKDAIDSMVKDVRLNIRVDWDGLEQSAARVAKTRSVNFKIKEQPLGRALEKLTFPHQIRFLIQKDQLILTSRESAEKSSQSLFDIDYEVAPLVTIVNPGRTDYDFDTLIDAVTTIVQPASWRDNGGLGSIERNSNQRMTTVRVHQNLDNHLIVSTLLDSLNRIQSGKKE